MTTPNNPPPLFRDQRAIDAGHLRTLSICHYVGAALGFVGLGFIGLHYLIMRTVFTNPAMWEKSQGGPPPELIMDMMQWFYLVGAVACVAYAVCNFLSARFIKARRHRTFSLVVAGFNCLHMPLGVLLGVFTFVVLSRDTVQEVYER